MTGRMLQQVRKILFVLTIQPCSVIKRLLPDIILFTGPVHDLSNSPGVIPCDKIIFIPEIPVKCRRRIPAVVHDLLYRDLINVFSLRNLLKRSCEDLFSCFSLHPIHLRDIGRFQCNLIRHFRYPEPVEGYLCKCNILCKCICHLKPVNPCSTYTSKNVTSSENAKCRNNIVHQMSFAGILHCADKSPIPFGSSSILSFF